MNASGHSAWQKCVGMSDMHQLLGYWTVSAAEPLSKNIKMNPHSSLLSHEKFNIHAKKLGCHFLNSYLADPKSLFTYFGRIKA